MEDTWFARDLPVLETIVEYFEQNPMSSELTHRISPPQGVSQEEYRNALRALVGEHPPFFAKVDMDWDGVQLVGMPTAHARRAVGAWPTPETLAETILAAIDRADENEPEDSDRKSKLAKLREAVGGVGRDLFVDIAAAAINRQVGLE